MTILEADKLEKIDFDTKLSATRDLAHLLSIDRDEVPDLSKFDPIITEEVTFYIKFFNGPYTDSF